MELKAKYDFFKIDYEINTKLNYFDIFKNNNPVHLEIGSGRGEFIYNKALQLPSINFFAVDIKEKRIKSIIRALDMEHHKNVRILKMFIDEESIKIFPENSIEKIYIMFPDPWPKRKHHRRRMINEKFIKILYNILTNKGTVEIVTDHQGYAEWIKNVFLSEKSFVPKYSEIYSREPEKNHIVTYFEEKMRKSGYIPYYFVFTKSGGK